MHRVVTIDTFQSRLALLKHTGSSVRYVARLGYDRRREMTRLNSVGQGVGLVLPHPLLFQGLEVRGTGAPAGCCVPSQTHGSLDSTDGICESRVVKVMGRRLGRGYRMCACSVQSLFACSVRSLFEGMTEQSCRSSGP